MLTEKLYVAQTTVDPALKELLYEIADNRGPAKEYLGVGNLYVSHWDVLEAEHPLLQRLRGELLSIASSLLNSSVRIVDSWFHIYRSGSSFKRHRHRNKKIAEHRGFALSYYLSRGDGNDSGQLKVYDPDILIAPQDGMVVVLPGYLEHEVLVYQGKADRIMLGCNLERLRD